MICTEERLRTAVPVKFVSATDNCIFRQYNDVCFRPFQLPNLTDFKRQYGFSVKNN